MASPYRPDRDKPDEFASPLRYEYIPKEEQWARQALADWFQVAPVPDPKRNIHPIDTLLDKVLAKLPMDEVGIAPEKLAEGWRKAAGPFLSQQANLASISKGVADIQVLQPAIRYHIQQWQGALLGKLQEEFGASCVKSIRIRIG